MRLDQWLWAVRLFKSRNLAAEAIKGGRVKVNDLPAKPAREIKPGEIFAVTFPTIVRTVRVLDAPKSRVGAKLVAQYLEDLTPPEEYARQRERLDAPGFRDPGTGRPTKRDRREIDELENDFGRFF
jgi:ribosome-associated heat shock protein Hsp15